ncbi:DUF3379 family protein [Marinobacterium jannaschii]|uniref:DUF3379 family protein n=1 Tax=Marinobacterium jannaschii TaxID=64970 RepID=UPI000483A8D6|nr:DUF3379 family protein [Marinobacterium jannaschii]
MNDLEFRRRVLSGETADQQLLDAAAGNPQRLRWLDQARQLDHSLQQATRITPPGDLAQRLKQGPRRRPFVKAIAGSAIAAALILAVTLQLYPRPATPDLPQALLAHLNHELVSLYADGPVQQQWVANAASRLGYKIDQPIPGISYAGACDVAGNKSLHLTVKTANSRASLFLMPALEKTAVSEFRLQKLHGRIIPLQQGSAAILSPSREDLDQLQQQIEQQISF